MKITKHSKNENPTWEKNEKPFERETRKLRQPVTLENKVYVPEGSNNKTIMNRTWDTEYTLNVYSLCLMREKCTAEGAICLIGGAKFTITHYDMNGRVIKKTEMSSGTQILSDVFGQIMIDNGHFVHGGRTADEDLHSYKIGKRFVSVEPYESGRIGEDNHKDISDLIPEEILNQLCAPVDKVLLSIYERETEPVKPTLKEMLCQTVGETYRRIMGTNS